MFKYLLSFLFTLIITLTLFISPAYAADIIVGPIKLAIPLSVNDEGILEADISLTDMPGMPDRTDTLTSAGAINPGDIYDDQSGKHYCMVATTGGRGPAIGSCWVSIGTANRGTVTITAVRRKFSNGSIDSAGTISGPLNQAIPLPANGRTNQLNFNWTPTIGYPSISIAPKEIARSATNKVTATVNFPAEYPISPEYTFFVFEEADTSYASALGGLRIDNCSGRQCTVRTPSGAITNPNYENNQLTFDIPTSSLQENHTYKVIVNIGAAANDAVRDTFTVTGTIRQDLTIHLQPDTLTDEETATARITATIDNSTRENYQIKINGNIVGSGDCPGGSCNIVFSPGTRTGGDPAATYTVLVQNSAGSLTGSAVLKVTRRTPNPTGTTGPTARPTIARGGGASGAGTPCTDSPASVEHPGIKTAIGCVPADPAGFILAVSRLLSGAGGGIALLLMIAGAFRMITSGGNPDGIKAGSEQFTSALIGLLFIIFAVLLLKVIGVDILNLPGFMA